MSPDDELSTVTDEHSAARLRLEFRARLARPGIDADSADELRDGLERLDSEWPGAARRGAVATEEELGGLSSELRRTRRSERDRQGIDARHAARERRRESSSSSSGSGRRRRAPASSSRGVAAAAYRGATFRRTGVPSAASSVSGLALKGIGVAIGLSLLYLVVSTPGSSGFAKLLDAIGKFARVMVAPVDPLDPASYKNPTFARASYAGSPQQQQLADVAGLPAADIFPGSPAIPVFTLTPPPPPPRPGTLNRPTGSRAG